MMHRAGGSEFGGITIRMKLLKNPFQNEISPQSMNEIKR